MENEFKNKSILIVEDCPITQASLQEALSLYFKFVYVAEDGCDGLEMIKKYQPDIVLSDINMPYVNGYDLVKEAKEQHISSIFIFISANNDSKSMLNAIDVKVDAYMVKPINLTLLMDKIKKLLEASDAEKNSKDILHMTLSDREYEVFLDLAKGIQPRVIASKYNIKAKTISTYRQRIMKKMQMNNNSDVIKYAIKYNLI